MCPALQFKECMPKPKVLWLATETMFPAKKKKTSVDFKHILYILN